MRRWFTVLLVLISAASFGGERSRPTVVFIPGAGSSGDQVYIEGLTWALPLVGGNKYFSKFQKALDAQGVNSFVCPETQDKDARTTEEREEECVEQILSYQRAQQLWNRSLILVGHSMGGLIARELAQDWRVADLIDSVTLIATPNQGTPLADFAIQHSTNDESGNFDFWGKLVELIHFVPDHVHYLPELKTDRDVDPAIFRAQETPDNPDVTYYSFSGYMDHIPIAPLEVTRAVIASELHKRGLDQSPYGSKNDGLVPLYSMIHGIHLGTLNAFHWASACIDPVKWTKSCSNALNLVIPHLVSLAHQVETKQAP